MKNGWDGVVRELIISPRGAEAFVDTYVDISSSVHPLIPWSGPPDDMVESTLPPW